MKKQISVLIALIAILGILSIQTSQAQSYKHKLANSSKNTVEFVLSRSTISIKGYNGNQIIIQNSDYQAPPKRARGLHAIGGNGTDNTGIGVSVHKENNTLKVEQMNARGGDFTVKVPNNVRIKIRRRRLPGSDIHISNHKGEIEIKTLTGDINLENVTGPVVAHSTSGDINVVFSDLSDVAPSSITAISGHVDVSLPAATKAHLKLSSVTGQIYTDFEMAMQNKHHDLVQIGGREVNSTLNGGGIELNLKSISGNIYLRKK